MQHGSVERFNFETTWQGNGDISKISMLIYDSKGVCAACRLLLTMNSCREMPWRWWFCPNFSNISTRHSVSSKLSTILVRVYTTLVQWAWNFRLLGKSFRGMSLNDLKCLWWLGFASKNLRNTNISCYNEIAVSVNWIHPILCAVDTMDFLRRVKDGEAWSWTLFFI
jgi:hypothetical protein